MTSERFHNIAIGCLAIFSILSILIAFHQFVYTRELATRMNSSHDIETVRLMDGVIWIRINSIFDNVGETRIEIPRVRVIVQQITPVDETMAEQIVSNPVSFDDISIIPWPTIAERWVEANFFIEPGEQHFTATEFLFPERLEVVKIYTFVPSDLERPDHGWSAVTIINLQDSSIERVL